MIDAGQAVIAAWGWANPDIEAALLSPRSITLVIQHEIYKVAARPRLFGGMDKPGAGIDYPGGVCPDHRLRNLQEQIKPLTAVCAEATAFASSVMRTGRSSATPQPTVLVVTNGQDAPVQRSEAEQRLADLLKRQAALVEDLSEQGEREYQKNVAEIARVSDEIAAVKKMEVPHG
jgi:hypothetical protein